MEETTQNEHYYTIKDFAILAAKSHISALTPQENFDRCAYQEFLFEKEILIEQKDGDYIFNNENDRKIFVKYYNNEIEKTHNGLKLKQ